MELSLNHCSMNPGFSRNQYIVISLTILCYLWLCVGLSWNILLHAGHDDRLQMNAAYTILSNHWLGDYYRLTMVKGVGFPLLMVVLFYLGFPLLISMPILYAAASFFFIHALRPAVRRRWPLVFAFIVLLFNPMQYHPAVLRIYRDSWTNCILLFVLAGAIGLLCRRHCDMLRQVGWTVLLGFSLGLFWLMREEAVWITPILALIMVPMAFISFFREHRFFVGRMLIVVGIPLGISTLMVQTVCYLNWRHYGLWASVDTTSQNYTKALSLLVKAKTDNWRPYVVCPQDVREKFYAVSPAFAELRPFLDGEGSGIKGWQSAAKGTGVVDEYGPWFLWALRDAVDAAGYYANAAKADAYYARLAKELETAYAEGWIEKEPGWVFGGFTQPFDWRHLPTLLAALRQGLDMLLLNNWQLYFSKAPSVVVQAEIHPEFWFAMRDIGNINIPSADPYLPKPSVKIRGWCFSPGQGQCNFALTTNNESCKIEILREDREDVRKYFAQLQGVDDPASASSGFVIKTSGEAACASAPLLVSAGRQQALIDITTGKVPDTNRHILIHVDELKGVKISSLRNNLDNSRRKILEQIATIYQYATKWLALIAVVSLAGYLAWALWRKNFSLWSLPYISVALLALCLLRMVMLALLHTVFGPFSLNWMYISPAYVGMYGGIAVCFVWLCEGKWGKTA